MTRRAYRRPAPGDTQSLRASWRAAPLRRPARGEPAVDRRVNPHAPFDDDPADTVGIPAGRALNDLGALALDTVVSLAAATVVGVGLVAVFL